MFEIALFGWLFWSILIVGSIALTALIANDKYLWGTSVLVLVIAAFWKTLFSGLPVLGLLLVALGYFVFGALWSLWKWRGFAKNTVQDYNNGNRYYQIATLEKLTYYLSPGEHKDRIYTWILFWPWSSFWAITGDLLKNIFESLRGLYNNITASALKDVKQ